MNWVVAERLFGEFMGGVGGGGVFFLSVLFRTCVCFGGWGGGWWGGGGVGGWVGITAFSRYYF